MKSRRYSYPEAIRAEKIKKVFREASANLEQRIENNTKREIKEISIKLERQTESLNRIKRLLKGNRFKEVQKMTYEAETSKRHIGS